MLERHNLFEPAPRAASSDGVEPASATRARTGLFDGPDVVGGEQDRRAPARPARGGTSTAAKSRGRLTPTRADARVRLTSIARRAPLVATVAAATGAGTGAAVAIALHSGTAAEHGRAGVARSVEPGERAARACRPVRSTATRRREEPARPPERARHQRAGARDGAARRRGTPARRDARRRARRAAPERRAAASTVASNRPLTTRSAPVPAPPPPTASTATRLPGPSSTPAAGAADSSRAQSPDAREFGIE